MRICVCGGGHMSSQQANSIQLDVDLMAQPGFSLDQLMELAGLSVASAITKEYVLADRPNILIVAGPGNNGGDSLVAARYIFRSMKYKLIEH